MSLCCSHVDESWIGMWMDDGMRWDDGTKVDFTPWAAGDPDFPDEPEQHAVIQYYNTFKDRETKQRYPFVCQHDSRCRPKVRPSTADRCPAPFLPLGTRCVHLNDKSETRFKAARACAIMCDDCTLLSIHSQDEVDVISEWLWAK